MERKKRSKRAVSFLAFNKVVSVRGVRVEVGVAAGEDTERLLMVVTGTMIIYSAGRIRKQPIRDQTQSPES